MTPEEFAAGMALMLEIYPKDLHPKASDTYATLLGHLPGPIWEATVTEQLRTSRWFPTPAELLETARRIVAGQAGVLTPEAAWAAVHAAMAAGASLRETLDDATYQAVATAFSGTRVERRAFLAAYEPGYRDLTDTALAIGTTLLRIGGR